MSIKFTNSELGICAIVQQIDNGRFKVIAFDTDADMMIEARFGFACESSAIEYAQKFIADIATGELTFLEL